MKAEHVHSAVVQAVAGLPGGLVAPGQLRRESSGAREWGLRQLVDHSLRVSARHRLWRSERSSRTEYNPTGLRTSDGSPLWLQSEYVWDHWGGRHDVLGWVRHDQLPDWAWEGADLPWVGASLQWRLGEIWMPNPRHVTDAHPERWALIGLDVNQVRFRIKSRVVEMQNALRAEPSLAAPFWYEPKDGNGMVTWVAPLALNGPDSELAAILVPHGGRYALVTVLPLHEAFWNVTCLGVVPPNWLNGSGGPQDMVLAA